MAAHSPSSDQKKKRIIMMVLLAVLLMSVSMFLVQRDDAKTIIIAFPNGIEIEAEVSDTPEKLLFGLAFLLMAGEDADHRSAQNFGEVDPLFRLGDLGVALLARRVAELVADGRARDVEAQPKTPLSQRVQITGGRLFREVVACQLRAFETKLCAVIDKILERELGLFSLLGQQQFAIAIGRETELEFWLAIAGDRLDGESASGKAADSE